MILYIPVKTAIIFYEKTLIKIIYGTSQKQSVSNTFTNLVIMKFDNLQYGSFISQYSISVYDGEIFIIIYLPDVLASVSRPYY